MNADVLMLHLANARSLADKPDDSRALMVVAAAFMVFGGVVYFDVDGEICRVAALVPGRNTEFSITFESLCEVGYEAARAMQEHMQPVLYESLASKNLVRFCW
eukprot:3722967-Prymnesium_polylepis.1